MMKLFTNYLKKLVYLHVLIGFSLVHAGSYEDFFSAIQQDEAGKVKVLLQRGFDANTLDAQGRPGLVAALQTQPPSLKAAEVLADWAKTDANVLNAKGESPLMLAALKGHQALAAKLIKRGADVNKTGWTPLHYAASGDKPEMIALLLENNAYIDAESPNGSTPLMMAAMYGTAPLVKLLLEEGADTSLKNQQGLTALQFAQRGNRPDAATLISAAMVKAFRGKRPAGTW